MSEPGPEVPSAWNALATMRAALEDLDEAGQ
jgi:hypothetical protein